MLDRLHILCWLICNTSPESIGSLYQNTQPTSHSKKEKGQPWHAGLLSRNSWEMEKLIVRKNKVTVLLRACTWIPQKIKKKVQTWHAGLLSRNSWEIEKLIVRKNKVTVSLHTCTWLLQKRKKCRRCSQVRHAGLLSRNSWEMEKLLVEKNELLLTIHFTNQTR